MAVAIGAALGCATPWQELRRDAIDPVHRLLHHSYPEAFQEGNPAALKALFADGAEGDALMGRGNAGHWLQVSLEGRRSNRDAIGATVLARVGGRTQIRQVAAGSGFLSSSSRVLHFGLGADERVEELVVRWPSGERQVLRDLPANQRIALREGENEPGALASGAIPR